MDIRKKAKLQARILKQAASMKDRPKRDKGGRSRMWAGSAIGVAAFLLARRRRQARRPARRFVNDQGVGPAHVKGVPKGEERALKHPSDEASHPTGRAIGSISPA